MTDEQRARVSAAHMGHITPPEWRAKLSAANKGQVPPNKGIPMSEATKAKIGAANWKGGAQVASLRHHAVRRALGFIPLNMRFDGCEGHHVDKEFVIYLPRELHRSVTHNIWTGVGIDQINALALAWLAESSD